MSITPTSGNDVAVKLPLQKPRFNHVNGYQTEEQHGRRTVLLCLVAVVPGGIVFASEMHQLAAILLTISCVNDDRSKRSQTPSAVSSPDGILKSDLTKAIEGLRLQQQKNKISVIFAFIVVVVSIAAIVAVLISILRETLMRCRHLWRKVNLGSTLRTICLTLPDLLSQGGSTSFL